MKLCRFPRTNWNRKQFVREKLQTAVDGRKRAAQGSGGVTIPGGVQKRCGYGTSGHGLAGIVVMGWQLDLMILEVFSNLNDSVILWKAGLQHRHESSLHINPELLDGARSPCHSLLGLGQLHIPESSAAIWQKQYFFSLDDFNVYTKAGQRSPSNKQLILPQQVRILCILLPWEEHLREGIQYWRISEDMMEMGKRQRRDSSSISCWANRVCGTEQRFFTGIVLYDCAVEALERLLLTSRGHQKISECTERPIWANTSKKSILYKIAPNLITYLIFVF